MKQKLLHNYKVWKNSLSFALDNLKRFATANMGAYTAKVVRIIVSQVKLKIVFMLSMIVWENLILFMQDANQERSSEQIPFRT